MTGHTAVPPAYTRTLPGEDTGAGGIGDSLNLILIVAIAVFITVLARHLAGKGGGKK